MCDFGDDGKVGVLNSVFLFLHSAETVYNGHAFSFEWASLLSI